MAEAMPPKPLPMTTARGRTLPATRAGGFSVEAAEIIQLNLTVGTDFFHPAGHATHEPDQAEETFLNLGREA